MSVDLAAVADFEDEHEQFVIVNLVEDAPIADADPPSPWVADDLGRLAGLRVLG
jgi:hypothetical protein